MMPAGAARAFVYYGKGLLQEPGAGCPWEALVSAAERRRFGALADREAREQAIAGRALLRAALSRHAAVAPEAWLIECSSDGKPYVAGPVSGLTFNLTHTRGLIACVVSDEGAVGIDAERIDDRVDTDRIAERLFAPPERRALAALSPVERRRAFFELWTLKEAYAKGCGLGLRLPFDSFAFDLTTEAPRLHFLDDASSDEGHRWQFVRLRRNREHAVALAVRTARPLIVCELLGLPAGGFSAVAETRVT
jgi:4'-phosphopantetheinyl transferase